MEEELEYVNEDVMSIDDKSTTTPLKNEKLNSKEITEMRKRLIQEELESSKSIPITSKSIIKDVFESIHKIELKIIEIVKCVIDRPELKKRIHHLKSIDEMKRQYTYLIEKAEDIIKSNYITHQDIPSSKYDKNEKLNIEKEIEIIDEDLSYIYKNISDYLCLNAYWHMPLLSNYHEHYLREMQPSLIIDRNFRRKSNVKEDLKDENLSSSFDFNKEKIENEIIKSEEISEDSSDID